MRRTLFLFFLTCPLVVAACSWNPARPFDREAPASKEAIIALDAGDAMFATQHLEDYLVTGPCKGGAIGISEAIRTKSNGTFDLGLALFALGETYGERFGEEEMDSGLPPALRKQREEAVDCAVHLLEVIANDGSAPLSLRAKAHYLLGNLHFLLAKYENAVADYNRALEIWPGNEEAGASDVGRDAAWNRAIALRRIEDKKDSGSDASPTGDGGENGDSGSNDGGSDGGGDSGKGDGGSPPDDKDGGNNDKNDQPDGGNDASSPPPPPPPEFDASAPPPKEQPSQDDRILDLLERAPTVQQEVAKKAGAHRVRGTVDK